MVIRLYDSHTIKQLDTTNYKQEHLAYLQELVSNQPAAYIDNVSAEMHLLQINDLFLPVTVMNTVDDSSYVVSLYNQYITYAREELWELGSPRLEWFLDKVLTGFGQVLKFGGLNQTVIVNNWLLSTNLYYDMSKTELKKITDYLTEHFPNHAIVFRSICESFAPEVYNHLKNLQYQSVLSRSILLFEAKSLSDLTRSQRKQLIRDKKLIEENATYSVKEIEDTKYFKDIVAIYNKLYIDKYSRHNPQFNESFIATAWEHNFLKIIGVFDQDDHLKGVLGYFQIEDTITAPLLGYDTNVPREDGLYRILTYLLTSEGFKLHANIHRSAGVADFKKLRGSRNELEYIFFYSKHLPLKQRLVWRIFSSVYNKVGTMLQRKFKF